MRKCFVLGIICIFLKCYICEFVFKSEYVNNFSGVVNVVLCQLIFTDMSFITLPRSV